MTIPEPILDSVRGYLMDVRGGSHTVANMRYFAENHEYGDPADIPDDWAELRDKDHVTKEMHAEVLWRAFKRAERAFLREVEDELNRQVGFRADNLTIEMCLGKGDDPKKVAGLILAEIFDRGPIQQLERE